MSDARKTVNSPLIFQTRFSYDVKLKRYTLSTSISRSFIDLPENIEAKLFIRPLLYTWHIKSAIYSSKSFTITA